MTKTKKWTGTGYIVHRTESRELLKSMDINRGAVEVWENKNRIER